jgi:hypothetical protein
MAFKKSLILSTITVISAVISFAWLKIGSEQVKPFFLLGGLLLLPTLWGISTFLITPHFLTMIANTLIVLIFLFIGNFQVIYLICATLLVFALFWGEKKIAQEKNTRVKILVDEITAKGIRWVLFSLAVIVGVSFYFSPEVQKLKEGINLPPQISAKILSFVTPGFNMDLSVNEMLNVMMGKEKNAPLPDPLQKELLKKLDLADLNLNGNEKISQKPEILDKLVTEKINQIIKGLDFYFPLIVAFSVFQILVWANKLLLLVIVFLDSLIYLILKSAGFVKTENIIINKEVIKI